MLLENRQIIDFLNYPDRALVAHAIERANLTAPEWECIRLREYEAETIESAAEILDLSTRTVKRRYANGMNKLDCCWSGAALDQLNYKAISKKKPGFSRLLFVMKLS